MEIKQYNVKHSSNR